MGEAGPTAGRALPCPSRRCHGPRGSRGSPGPGRPWRGPGLLRAALTPGATAHPPPRPGAHGTAPAGHPGLEGPLPAHAGSKPRPKPARAGSLAPPGPCPKPIKAWHRLSNRLTNPAPPIAGRPGRALGRQAGLRAPGWKSLKLSQPPGLVHAEPGWRAPRRVQVAALAVKSRCNGRSVCPHHPVSFPHSRSQLLEEKPLSLLSHFVKGCNVQAGSNAKCMCPFFFLVSTSTVIRYSMPYQCGRRGRLRRQPFQDAGYLGVAA